MEGIGLDIIIVLATAIVGGMLARLLRMPILLGYLVGGIAIGPYGFGLVGEMDTIHNMATIGVVLLLFTIGLEFSLKDVMRLGKIALLGGLSQVLLTAAVGLGLGSLIGFEFTEAVFFGFVIALSSTMVVLKLLMERGELDSGHGRVMIGILLVQDLSVVPLMVIMPAIGAGLGGAELWVSLGVAGLKAVFFIIVMLVLGVWVLPWILGKIAAQRSHELFMLSVITLCLMAAFGTYYFGLSAAFGAFVAGLLISQSAFARQALADIVPLRDTFGALFFVSLGMLASLNFVVENLSTIAIVVAVILVAKFIICSFIPLVFRHSYKTALFTGMGLVQIGEFSFVLAMMGVEAGIFSEYLYSLVIAAAIITMLLTPFNLNFASFIYRHLSQQERFARLFARRPELDWKSRGLEMARHAVICGYGRIGSRLATVLERQKFSYLVIDLDPQVISRLRGGTVPCIYGDAANPEILAHAQLEKARVLICTFPDFISVDLIVRNALKINPKLDIVAVVGRDADAELLKGLGVSEVVQPHFEGGLEVIRHSLHRFGLSGTEIQYVLVGLREGRL
ncbi:cation:proton antiporter [Chloroflexota bacterium]